MPVFLSILLYFICAVSCSRLRRTPPEIVKPTRCSNGSVLVFGACNFPYRLMNKDSIIVDMGQTVAGVIKLPVQTANQGQLQIGFCESDASLDPRGDALSQHPINQPNYYPMVVSVNQSTTIQSDFSGAFRYAYITWNGNGYLDIQDTVTLVQLSLAVPRDQDYPGSFECSDNNLTDMWYIAVATMEISTGGVATGNKVRQLLDGGKRDRAVWTADLWVQQLVSLTSTWDVDAVKTSLESLAKNQTDLGYIPHLAPVEGEPVKVALEYAQKLKFAEYVCWWVLTAWDYYWFTGDLAWITKMYPVARKAISWLYELTEDNGLVSLSWGVGGFDGNGSPWHTPDATTGTVTHVNFLLHMALERILEWENVTGIQPEEKIAQWRDLLKNSINTKLWDDVNKIYMNTNDAIGHPQVVVQDGNAVGVMSDVISDDRKLDVLNSIAKYLHTEYGSLTVDREVLWPPALDMFPFMSRYISPYSTFLELYARIKYAKEQRAASQIQTSTTLSLLRRCWIQMMKKSPQGATTFWEKMSVDGSIEPYRQTKMPVSYTSLAHGWATGPVYILSWTVLGVQPTCPGFKCVQIHPLAIESGLEWANGRVPTPMGSISVKWNYTGATQDSSNSIWYFEVSLPNVIDANVVLLNGSTVNVKGPGQFHWSS